MPLWIESGFQLKFVRLSVDFRLASPWCSFLGFGQWVESAAVGFAGLQGLVSLTWRRLHAIVKP